MTWRRQNNTLYLNQDFFKILIGFFSLFIVISFYNIGNYGLMDVDEPRYAEAAREMIESGNWIVPYFNYEVRYDKPVFFYWLEAVAMLIFGVNEFSARIPSLLCSFLCLFLVYRFLRSFFQRYTALLGVLILMSSLEFLALSRFSTPDMTLATFLTGSIISFYLGYIEILNSSRFFKDQILFFSYWYILGFIFLALAVLTKGPVAIILDFLIFIPFFWWIRKLEYFFKNKSFYVGFFVFLILVFPWYCMVHVATGGEFTKTFFGVHNFSRFTSVVSGHKGSLLFFIPVVIVGFLPWIFFLPQAISSVIQKGLGSLINSLKDQTLWFCLWWFIVIFLFFSFSRTQLLTYILPLFPALSIITVSWFDELLSKKTSSSGLVISLTIFFIFCLIVLYISIFKLDMILPVGKKGLDLGFQNIILPFILLVGISMSWASSNKDVVTTLSIILCTFAIIYFSLVSILFPQIDIHSQSMLRTFSRSIPHNVEIATYKIAKPSITFYAKRKIKKINKIEKLTKKILGENKFAFITKKAYLEGISLPGAIKWGEDYRYIFYKNY